MAGKLTPATSQRKAIRAGIVGQLLGFTRAGARVVPNRFEAWDHAANGGELPCIAVYTLAEGAELFQEAPREYKRTVRVRVECLLDQQSGKVGDDELDDFLNEVEALLLTDETAGGTASRALYEELLIGETVEGERPILVGILTFAYDYYTEVDELGDLANDLRRVHVDWRGGLDPFRADLNAAGDPLRKGTEEPAAVDEFGI